MYLHHDNQWRKANSKFEAHIKSFAAMQRIIVAIGKCIVVLVVSYFIALLSRGLFGTLVTVKVKVSISIVYVGKNGSRFDINRQMDAAIYQVNNIVGEWFEEVKEFRAAIWCYNNNLSAARDVNVLFPQEARDDSLASQLVISDWPIKEWTTLLMLADITKKLFLHAMPSACPDKGRLLLHNAKLLPSACSKRVVWNIWKNHELEILGRYSRIKYMLSLWRRWSCQQVSGLPCNLDCQKGHWKTVHK